MLLDYNAFLNGTFNHDSDDFYSYASQKYNVTKNDIDFCKYYICGYPSYYDDPEEVTKGFLTNDAEEIEKSKVALIEQIALYSNYTLTMQELDICLDVSLLF